jgi:hypothetical protein
VAWPEEGDDPGGPMLGRKAAQASRLAGPVQGFHGRKKKEGAVG